MPRRLREPPLPAPSWRRRWLPIRSHGPPRHGGRHWLYCVFRRWLWRKTSLTTSFSAESMVSTNAEIRCRPCRNCIADRMVVGTNFANQIGSGKRLNGMASARFLSAINNWLTTPQSASVRRLLKGCKVEIFHVVKWLKP